MTWRITSGWNPSQLGADLELWLDAEDASTITLNGSNVAQWSDKSGNSRNATQATAAAQPLYAPTGFNGKPTVRFDQDFLIETTTQFPLIARTVFFVVNETTSVPNAGILSVLPEEGQFNDWNRPDAVSLETGNNLQQIAVFGSTFYSYSLVVPPGVLTSGIYGEVKSAGMGKMFVNGSDEITDTTFTEFSAQSGGGYLLGARWLSGAVNSTTYGLRGDIGEVVYVGATLSTEDRQKLEGYLAWKWGLVASLPSNHPYKTYPPARS